jgi:hypothetical protein
MQEWEWNQLAARYMAYWPASAARFGDVTIAIWFERLEPYETGQVLKALDVLSREPNDYGPSLGRVEATIYELDGGRPTLLDAVAAFEKGLAGRPLLGEPEHAPVERALFAVESACGGLAREFVENHWRRIRGADLAPGRFALRDLEREWREFFDDAARTDRVAAAELTSQRAMSLIAAREPGQLGGGSAGGITALLPGVGSRG